MSDIVGLNGRNLTDVRIVSMAIQELPDYFRRQPLNDADDVLAYEAWGVCAGMCHRLGADEQKSIDAAKACIKAGYGHSVVRFCHDAPVAAFLPLLTSAESLSKLEDKTPHICYRSTQDGRIGVGVCMRALM